MGFGGRLRVEVPSDRARAHLARRAPGGEAAPRRFDVGGVEVALLQGDITQVFTDAVVNASNSQLRLGGGVSGALKRAAGPRLQAAMSAAAPIGPGQVVLTPAFDLPRTDRVLHVATASGRQADVEAAMRGLMDACVEHRLRSIALPALGCGTGGLLPSLCAAILRRSVIEHAARGPTYPTRVIAVLWSRGDLVDFEAAFAESVD